MKQIMSLLGGIVLVLASVLLQSCSDEYDPGILTQHDLDVNDYTKNFMAHYGAIDPNHNWGFENMSGIAQTRSTVDNKNEWTSYMDVPGWPDTFFYSDGTSGNYGYQYSDNGGKYVGYSNTIPGQALPAGDVTEEEIMYVSHWFRTHQNPESITLHWTDFFVQEISSDNDRNADGTIMNQQTIYTRENTESPWVEKGKNTDDFGINLFCAYSIESQSSSSSDLPSGTSLHWDHIKNFNLGASNSLHNVADVPMQGEDWYKELNYTLNGNTVSATKDRLIGYYKSSGTEDFLAQYSEDSKLRNTIDDSSKKIWVLVHLEFDGKPDATGKRRHYDGYYLAFDYQCNNIESSSLKKYVVEPDGYYSNWIVKLSPASEPAPTKEVKRVMCEDLGNTFDFDFNDVVFDVYFDRVSGDWDGDPNASFDAVITLQAAGGTMPVYVGHAPTDEGGFYEAHNLLGAYPANVPVNVGSSYSAPVANYRIHGFKQDQCNPKNIKVYVVNNGHQYTLENDDNFSQNYTGSVNNEHNDIVNGTNAAPQKFCVPNTIRWMKECQFIEWEYYLFPEWVKDANFTQNGKQWYEFTRNSGKLY